MAVGGDDRSANRNYPLPTPGNWLSEDMARLITALEAIDVDVAGLLTAVAARALLVHSHTISQITGLQDALDGKQNVGAVTTALDDLIDVNVTGASALQVLMKSAGSGWVAGIVDAANLSGWAAKLASSSIDAGQILSGTLDPARIPVLAADKTIISSGAIADLTSGQQAQISTGTHVTTTDGRRWIYSGSGSKTAEASYIEMADVTPEWAVIANKPGLLTSLAALSIVAGDLIFGTGAGTLGRLAAADGFLKSTGGVLSWAALDNLWPAGFLFGLTLSRASATTFGIAPGSCRNENSGTGYNMSLGAAVTKSLSAWAAGSGNGGLFTGTIAPNSSYHAYIIRKDSDGSFDAGIDPSATTPSVPAGYTAFRRVGAILTNGSSQIRPFIQLGQRFVLTATVTEMNAAVATTVAQTVSLLGVPTGLTVDADISIQTSATPAVNAYVSSLLQDDEAPSSSGAPLYTCQTGAANVPARVRIPTNTSGQVRTRNSASTSLTMTIVTHGWFDRLGMH